MFTFKKKNINLYIVIFLILLLFYILYVSYSLKKKETYINDNDFHNFIKNHILYNENNEKIDHYNIENSEQYQAYKYIKPDDIVLELGGRYGSVSLVINKIVKEKKNHVVVEPDINIIPALEKNKKLNNCDFTICPKFISNKNKKIIYDGYSTHILDNNSQNKNEHQITYDEFKKLYPQKFNVLVADCEGCICEFLESMGDDFNHLKKIIYEEDKPELCDYQKIKEKILSSGFVEKNKDFNVVNRYVFIKE